MRAVYAASDGGALPAAVSHRATLRVAKKGCPMSTYDDSLLAIRFAALAPEPLPGNWADVVGRVDSGWKGRRELGLPDALSRRRRRLVVVLAVVALVAVVSASALAVRAFVIEKGFIGIPPIGATPSTPTRGELVLSAYGVTRHSRNKVWVYRDGRMIFQRELHPGTKHPPGSANRESTGFLERQLTPKGIESLRSEILSTGLFGHDRELEMARPVPFFNYIYVRNGGQLVRVTWHQDPPYASEHAYPLATREQATTLQRLVARVTEPETWLPSSAWRDRQVRAYVPATFELGYGPWPLDAKYSDILKKLPAPARDVLRATNPRRKRGLVGFQGDLVPAYTYFYTVTSEQARSLRTAFVDAGLEVDWRVGDVALAYRVGARHPKAGAISITFVSILPHGEPSGPGG